MSIEKKAFNGLARKGIKLEDMTTGQSYSITLNPKEQPNRIHPIHHLIKWYRTVYDDLLPYKDSVELKLYMESSPIGRLHFHGIISIINMVGYVDFLMYINKWYTYEIDTISEDEEGKVSWQEYYLKQHDIWLQLLNKHSLIGYPMKIMKDSPSMVGSDILSSPDKVKSVSGGPTKRKKR